MCDVLVHQCLMRETYEDHGRVFAGAITSDIYAHSLPGWQNQTAEPSPSDGGP